MLERKEQAAGSRQQAVAKNFDALKLFNEHENCGAAKTKKKNTEKEDAEEKRRTEPVQPQKAKRAE